MKGIYRNIANVYSCISSILHAVMMEDKEIDGAVNEVVFYVNGRKVPKINIRIAIAIYIASL